jgi:hypothetical protein
MSITSRATILSMITVLCSCCSVPAGHGVAPEPQRGGGAASYLTLTISEMAHLNQSQSLLAALQQTRPSFLYGRGTVSVVSVDGLAPTDLSVLRSIPVSDVYEVRLERATSGAGRTAVLASGAVVLTDVIVVVTRHP